MSKATAMLTKQRRQQLLIWRIVERNHLPIANQTVFNFREIDVVSKLGFVRRRFTPLNNLDVRLKQADDFVGRHDGLSLQGASLGLVNRLFHQEHPFAQLVMDALGENGGRLLRDGIDGARVFQTLPRDVQPFAMRLF